MKVKLMAHTQLSQEFKNELMAAEEPQHFGSATHGQVVSLSAIRTCYSANKPSEIVAEEGHKYFGLKAKEGKGSETDRLIRQIVQSGHTSTLEHITFTFSIEGVSRALLGQLTRHRVGTGYSVQSQRYVKQSSDSKHGGFDYVVPEKMEEKILVNTFEEMMRISQDHYDLLIKMGVPQEDARAVLPQAATCNLVFTINLRALLDFYGKRRAGKGAQQEITVLAQRLREEVVKVEHWTDEFFESMHRKDGDAKTLKRIKGILDSKKGDKLTQKQVIENILKVIEEGK